MTYRIRCLECGSMTFGDPCDSVESDKKWHRDHFCPDASFEVSGSED